MLDFRPRVHRRMAQAEACLKFFDDMHVTLIEEPGFALLLSSQDEPRLWGPCRSPDGKILVAICGRIALDESEWDKAQRTEGSGGIASKAILGLYQTRGIEAMHSLNGNYIVLIHDQESGKCYVVTDRCGMFLAYRREPLDNALVLSSHPDALASVLGEDQNLDTTSLAEFLITGRLTFPYTNYQRVRALDTGCVHTIDVRNGAPKYESKRQYFQFDFKIDPNASEAALAEQLADAFRNAVNRRTLPLLGPVAIGLSGGLDSRGILSAIRYPERILTFNLFDEENIEFQTAKDIAKACGVEFIPFQRDFEYYGNSADLGVRISAGMGNIASNHYLGIREHLSRLGIKNLLTGCYCDYLLKGLALNTVERKFTRSEELAGFGFDFYRTCYWAETVHSKNVQARLHALFPEARKEPRSDQDWLHIQQKRTFPLAYEADLAQRVIPQRVIPWYLPIVDNDIIDTYQKMPSRYKLNASIFKKMVLILCKEEVCQIPDCGTGAPVTASWGRHCFHRYLSALRNRINRNLSPRMATRGSWPNWAYYLRHSPKVHSLWARKNETARDLFVRILGTDPFQKSANQYRGREVEFFQRLLTQKLWLDQRAGVSAQ